MPTRSASDRKRRDAGRLVALRAAVNEGSADLSAGRYIEIDDDRLDDYLAELGERAAAHRLA